MREGPRPLTDDEMRECIARARRVASASGTMHAYWDTIFDAEQILAGKPSIASRGVVEKYFREWFPDLVNV